MFTVNYLIVSILTEEFFHGASSAYFQRPEREQKDMMVRWTELGVDGPGNSCKISTQEMLLSV